MEGYKIRLKVVRSHITEAHGRVARGLIWFLLLKVPVTAVRRTSSRKVKKEEKRKKERKKEKNNEKHSIQ